MTKDEFTRVFALADSDTDLSEVDDTPLHGCGLPGFQTVSATVEMVAKLVRWQGQYMLGGWDMDAVNEVRQLGRRRFEIIN